MLLGGATGKLLASLITISCSSLFVVIVISIVVIVDRIHLITLMIFHTLVTSTQFVLSHCAGSLQIRWQRMLPGSMFVTCLADCLTSTAPLVVSPSSADSNMLDRLFLGIFLG